ncbi:MAG: hypothetical protein JSS62_00360 [Verrucomicrobia bacterium]|nr:hypothetical protein [Verrucomicrobiota bacterium]MBS0646586.1 hypothetical protein [Verrucomicrobiota bacterium]
MTISYSRLDMFFQQQSSFEQKSSRIFTVVAVSLSFVALYAGTMHLREFKTYRGLGEILTSVFLFYLGTCQRSRYRENLCETDRKDSHQDAIASNLPADRGSSPSESFVPPRPVVFYIGDGDEDEDESI